MTEEDAFKLEKHLIKSIGRRDLGLGTLVNMTDGGEGLINCSEITKDKLRIPFSQERRTNISKAKKGKSVTKEMKIMLMEYAKVPIIHYNKNLEIIKEYSSIKDACNELKITNASIFRYCKKYFNAKDGSTFRYKIDHLPEREKKQFPNISPSDAVLSHIETRDIINLQCKSISLQIGHPITSNAASLFWKLLRDDQQLYNNLYPLDCDFSIEFTFDNPLDQKGYTANMLYDDIKHNNSRVKLSRFPGINRINSDEDRKQKRLMAFIAPIPSNHHHIIILHSLHRNEMETLLQKTIKEKINKNALQHIATTHAQSTNDIVYQKSFYKKINISAYRLTG